jgi:hypothetical protein
MQYIVRGVPLPLTPDEQARARAEFWDAVQKLSMLLGLVVAIRSLRKLWVRSILRNAPIFLRLRQRREYFSKGIVPAKKVS